MPFGPRSGPRPVGRGSKTYRKFSPSMTCSRVSGWSIPGCVLLRRLRHVPASDGCELLVEVSGLGSGPVAFLQDLVEFMPDE